MRGRWILRGVKFVLFLIVAAAALSWVVMHLWNWLMPTLFGLHAITFWQALGLLVLSKILVGSFRPRPDGRWRGRMKERWAAMTPEERETFRAGMRGGCGWRRTAEPKA
jgi:hypothetical protein